FLLTLSLPLCSSLFPYTTLFRSRDIHHDVARAEVTHGAKPHDVEFELFLPDVDADRHGGASGIADDTARQDAVPGLEAPNGAVRSEEHTSELQSLRHLVCRLLLE